MQCAAAVAEGANFGSGLTHPKLIPFRQDILYRRIKTMQLSDEIRQAAEDLGRQLNAETVVREYVKYQNGVQQDAEVVALEELYGQLYQKLAERQQNGESLERSELDEFYRLKRKMQDHPLIFIRDNQMVMVKALFAQTAQRLTDVLGIDYPTFAGKIDLARDGSSVFSQ
jgi:cell fate (sporulation/competence/biofilm development) regulator YlbF (YheA/YmcA/DUF963 family)